MFCLYGFVDCLVLSCRYPILCLCVVQVHNKAKEWYENRDKNQANIKQALGVIVEKEPSTMSELKEDIDLKRES